MALHKENYGLIYNDDGSLCTTIRADDIPFAGVKSFAVEEGTTNLVSNGSFETLQGSQGPWGDFTITASTDTTTKVCGNASQKHVVTGTTGGTRCYSFDNIPVSAGKQYTISVYLKGDRTITNYTNLIYVRFFDSSGAQISEKGYNTLPLSTSWQRHIATVVAPSGAVKMSVQCFVYQAVTLWADGLLVEAKPFATSFVDGTRAAPRLKIPFNYNGDWVLSFWFRPDWEWGTVPVATAREPTYNLASWGTPGTDGWLFRIAISNMPGYINFETYAPTVYSFANPANFGLNNRNWAYFVIVSDISNKLFKVYINGQLAISQSNTDWDMPPEDYVSIGTRRFSSNYGAANGLFSNILIARYDPNIWTDDYIRELYNAKKPFAVPPRMPII
jgi:hypothetical protein